jgi:hypothetical protein
MARSDPPAASMTRDPTRGTVSWPHSQQRCPPCSRSIMEGPDGVSLLSPFGSWICFPVDVMLRCRLDASQLQFTGQAAGWTRAGVGNWPHGARARAPGAGGRPHERQRTHVASGRRRRKGEERAAGTGPRGRRARPARATPGCGPHLGSQSLSSRTAAARSRLALLPRRGVFAPRQGGVRPAPAPRCPQRALDVLARGEDGLRPRAAVAAASCRHRRRQPLRWSRARPRGRRRRARAAPVQVCARRPQGWRGVRRRETVSTGGSVSSTRESLPIGRAAQARLPMSASWLQCAAGRARDRWRRTYA